MKRLWLCAVLLAFTTTATAADPFVGTYRLNVALSNISDTQPVPLAATLTVSEESDNLVLAISLQSSNCSTLKEHPRRRAAASSAESIEETPDTIPSR